MKLQINMDKSAMGLSFLCLVHCLLVPAIVLVLPALLAAPLQDERFHQILLFVIIPLSAIALFLGCKKHKSWSIFAWGIVGLAILLVGGLFAHDLVGEIGERVLTVAGSLIMMASHFTNYRNCQKHDCLCESK